MTTPNRRQIKALKTKNKLLETALKLFSEKGYDHVSVDEIVTTSGFSKGAFYTHFASKYEVFLEKFKEIDDFYIQFMKTIDNQLTSEQKLITLNKAQMDYLNQLGKEIIRTIYQNALTPTPNNFLMRPDRPLNHIIERIVIDGQQKGELTTSLSSKTITTMITRTIRGTIYDWCTQDDSFDLQQQSVQFLTMLLKGLRVQE